MQYTQLWRKIVGFMLWQIYSPLKKLQVPVAYPGILFGGGSANSVEDRRHRERGAGSCSSLIRGSGSSCNLVQEISFHMVKFS